MKDITLVFNGSEYLVRESNAWGLIESIEDVISLFELLPLLSSGKPPIAKVARAYAAALGYAGAGNVTPEQVIKGVDMAGLLTMAQQLAAILMFAFPQLEIEKAAQDVTAQEDSKKKAE